MSRKARPSEAALRERLREGHFTAAAPANATADPITATPMVVEVEDIAGYDRNPRQTPNRAFDVIKASIREDGLHQPLVITRRPDTEHYMMLRGGNTRLRAIQELFRETGDARFQKIHCLFEPWAGESHALLSHLIENDARGDLTFLDRARAIDELKRILEHDLETELSKRGLARLLRERGYRISPILISQMAYAVSELAPALPLAFQAGLGGDRVQRIRTLDQAGFAAWQRYELGASANYHTLFRKALARDDGPQWRFELARRRLAERLAECAGVATNEMQAALDAELAKDPSAPDTATVTPTPPTSVESSPSSKTKSTEPYAAPADEITGRESVDRSPNEEPAVPTTQPATVHTSEETADKSASARGLLNDIKSLRARAWTLATKLAQHYRIDDLIRPLPDRGLGYSIVEVIDPEALAKRDKIKAGEIGTLWWHLVACAELTSAPVEDLQSMLKTDGVLLAALAEGDLVRLLDAVPTYHVSQLAMALWSRMKEPDWHDLVALMETHRRLRATAAREHVALWHGEAIS